MDIERLGKYEVRGTLGKGAMGTVYSGWDPIISRKVAIKTVRLPDAADIDAQEELARFKREAQAAGRLNHPNIVGVFDYGETDQVAYIVMEFVDGTTLKTLVDAGERMAVPQVGRVMADILAGLAYSHERGVVHRDIKPANVMIVGGDGHGSGQAKIADFGIARIESSNLTQAGTIMGTPAYMSPEQFMGQTVDARTDIYSAGVLLFQLLTGERPFEGSMATIMHKALNTQPPKPSELSVTAPVALDAVVARAMAKRPEERYASAADFAEALRAALTAPARPAGLGTGLGDLLGADTDATLVKTAAPKPAGDRPPAASPPAAPAKAKSRGPVIAAIAVVVLAVGGGGAYFALSGPAATVAPAAPPTTVANAEPAQTPAAATPPAASPVPQAQIPSTPAPTAAAALPSTPTPAAPPAPRPQVTQVVPPQPAPAPTAAPETGSRLPSQTLPPLTAANTPAPVPAQIISPAVTPGVGPRPPAAAVSIPAPTASATTPGPAVAPVTEPTLAAPVTSRPTAPTTPVPTAAPIQQAAPAQEQAAVAPAPATPIPAPPASIDTGAAPTAAPTQLAAAGLSPKALRRAIAGSVAAVDCAVIGGEAGRGTVTLTGAVGQGRPEQELQRAVQDAAPGAAVDWRLGVLSGPYCGVLNALRTHARPFGSSGPALQLGTSDGRTAYQDNDTLDIRTVMPDFSSYLQVDDFQSDGTVSHFTNSVAGSPVLLGGSRGPQLAGTVGEPFGTDLVVGVASTLPLFAKGAALAEKTDDYVRQLHTALDEAARRGSKVAVSVLVLKTSPRQ